jgi:Putative prokaryotic signal transducing protein
MGSPELVTVYRSMDAAAKEDCETIVEILSDRNISALIVDDTAPGVPEGTFEVRVPAADSARAEAIVDENPLPDEVEEVDDSEDLDLETIFHSDGTMSEVEAMGVKNVLEANGIAAVLVGDSVLPTFGFDVKVARDQVENARRLIAQAEADGPAAADAGELESEKNPG